MVRVLLTVVFILTSLSANGSFTIPDLNTNPSVFKTWNAVDTSRYCYRVDVNKVYKDGEIITWTPLIPFILNNDKSKQLKDANDIIMSHCY